MHLLLKCSLPHFVLICLLTLFLEASFSIKLENQLNGPLMDILLPYDINSTTKLHTRAVGQDNQQIAACLSHNSGNVTHWLGSAHRNSSSTQIVERIQSFTLPAGGAHPPSSGYILWINNPDEYLHILEPGGRPGGCQKHVRVTVQQTVQQAVNGLKCKAAINAGYFGVYGVNNGKCLGSVVSEAQLVIDSHGVQNSHFGITATGKLFFGYLTESELKNPPGEEDSSADDRNSLWKLLVGGVLWIVRDGENYVHKSVQAECAKTETTGTLRKFAAVRSARSVVGVDGNGRVIMMVIDGQTEVSGLNLFEVADLLISLGVQQAVNLNGGGSSTLVVNNVLVNHPSDLCSHSDDRLRCARPVSTVLCAAPPPCAGGCSHTGSSGCSPHGVCQCLPGWEGERCELCFNNCTHGQGICNSTGCHCLPGFTGQVCQNKCPTDRYGADCTLTCQCLNGGRCKPITGECLCLPGFTGHLCQHVCPLGYFGDSCEHVCMCDQSSCCHHVTGQCNVSQAECECHTSRREHSVTGLWSKNIRVDENQQHYHQVLTAVIVLSVMGSISLLANISLICFLATRYSNSVCDPLNDPDTHKCVNGGRRRSDGYRLTSTQFTIASSQSDLDELADDEAEDGLTDLAALERRHAADRMRLLDRKDDLDPW